MPEFFLEIGTEEMPSRFIEPALKFLEGELSDHFNKNRIGMAASKVMGTPRRLIVSFSGVGPRQEDVVETFYGPSIKVAFDDQGNPTKAAVGFARGKGVEVSDMTTESTPKGDVICARVEKIGQPTENILNAFLPKLLVSIPFPKKMRWETRQVPFARPMHWIVALFDGKPLAFEFDGIRCSNTSRGHRFLSPESFQVHDLQSYLKECEKRFLMVDPQMRKQQIKEQLQNLSGEVSGVVQEDPDLLDEVNFLVEYPVAIRGDFEPGYLELPHELLTSTMKVHQRYFPVLGDNGKLLPHFITVSNMKPGEGQEIKHGNERVLKARLEDARFFFNEDRKQKLEDYVDALKGVIFQKSLGTSYEKVERIGSLARFISQKVCPDLSDQAERAALLCKADLVTQMVYEFPELQGIMGSYYAEHSGESPEVVEAIKDHYSPSFSGDRTPASDVGAVISISDKLDTILGCIGVGLLPSGSEDPYGLRRHSLGIIQIILDRNWQISLEELMNDGIRNLASKIKLKPEEIRNHAFNLFSQRYKTLLSGEGFPYDAIDAVLATGIDSLLDVRQKTIAFSELKKQPHFEPLAIAFRRIVSILNEEAKDEIRPDLFTEPAEKELYKEYTRLVDPVEESIRKKEFPKALEKIVEIKPAVDNFFDHVMVMVEEENLRRNRLGLLFKISRLFSNLADFSQIVLKKA